MVGLNKSQGQINSLDTRVNDLSTDVAGREPAFAGGTTLEYFRGDKTFVTLDTSVVPENTNLYFNDSRAQTAAVVNSTAGTQTNQAPSVAAVNSAITNATSSANLTHSLDEAYNDGSSVTVDSTDLTINLTGTQDFNVQDNGSPAFTVTDGGNVGIGTINPTSLLEVNAGITGDAILKIIACLLYTSPSPRD